MLGELSQDEIDVILNTNVIGRIGCCAKEKVYVVPITYVYDGEFIIGHTQEGVKITVLRENPECCFEVDMMESISNWKSVMAWGTFEELKGEEAEKALDKLLTKLEPLMASETSHPQRMGQNPASRTRTQGTNPIIYRIRLKEKTGRFERQ